MKRSFIRTIPLIAAFAATLATPLTAQEGNLIYLNDGSTIGVDVSASQAPAHPSLNAIAWEGANASLFSTRPDVVIGPYGEEMATAPNYRFRCIETITSHLEPITGSHLFSNDES